MQQFINTAVLASVSIGYCRGILRGVRNFAKPRHPWRFYTGDPSVENLAALLDYKPSGILAHTVNAPLAQALERLSLPIVNVANHLPDLQFPRVGVDDISVGELAASYYLERGFKNFAYFGTPGHEYSRLRYLGFRRALNAAGFDCFLYDFVSRDHEPISPGAAASAPIAARAEDIERWIRVLPKPVGIFACTDERAWTLSEICYGSGLRVPEEVSLLGADDDEFVCDLAHPTLSSVRLPTERIGYEAAALLAQLMAGKDPPARPILLPPEGVASRQSSDMLAIHDEDIVAAVRFIRERARTPIGVEDVLRQVPLSRRSLERKFRALLQRSPLDEIRRVRIEHAKQLLSASDLAIAQVAAQSGYQGPERFSTAFREETGLTPRDYRKKYQRSK